jgi:hypothetical protein
MTDAQHVAFCISDNYSSIVAVTLQSFVDHHTNESVFIFHIVSEAMSADNLAYLKSVIAPRPSWQLVYHPIEKKNLAHIPTGPFTIHTWYRIFLDQLLPEEVEKVLYLDADTLIASSIDELFQIPLENVAIGAAKDQQNFIIATKQRIGLPQQHTYVCAGVLLMNLSYWREHNIAQQILDWAIANAHRLGCPDQDAINVVLREKTVVLPAKWGIIARNFLYDAFYQTEEAAEAYHHPCIIHYAGCAPWYYELSKIAPRFQELWYETNKRMEQPVEMRSYFPSIIKRLKALFRHIQEGRLTYPRITSAFIEQKLQQFNWI